MPTEKTVAQKKVLFIEGFAKTGVIGTGCHHAKISRRTHKRWAEKDPSFLLDCQDAYEASVDSAEEEFRYRSVEGSDEVVTYKGEVIWKLDPETGEKILDENGKPTPFTVKKKSDKLLEVYMKAHRPAYREPKGGVTVNIDPVPRNILDVKEGGDNDDEGIQITYILPDGKEVNGYDEGTSTTKKLEQENKTQSDWDEFFG